MSHLRRSNGFWHADDFMLDYTGVRDVALDLNYIWSSVMEPGDVFSFRTDGQYLCDNEIALTEIVGRTILGNDACLFGTVERNNKFIHALGCQDLEFRNLHIFGYTDFDSLGSQMVAGTGTPTVSGTTMLLDALNESVFVPRSLTIGTSGGALPYALGRDKDGYSRIKLTLSDSAHVANDCQVVVTDGFGTTLETITIPLLTGTPTVYEVHHKLLDPRDRLDWEVKKATATANTITITFCKTVCPNGYNSTIFNNAGWDFTGTNGLRLFDCSVEGVGGDAIQCSSPFASGYTFAKDALIRGFTSRCCTRQGVSFNSNKSVRFEDFDIYFCGRSGIDIEPETIGNVVEDMTISNGRIWAPTNSGIAATGWSWISRMNISDLEIYDCGRAAIEGGSQGGSIHGVRSSVIHRADGTGGSGTLWPDFMITGQDMKLSDIDADRGFFFIAETRVDRNNVLVSSGGYSLDGFTVQRQGLYGAVAQMAGVDLTVTGGPGTQVDLVPVYGRTSAHLAVGPAGGLRHFAALDLGLHHNRLPGSYSRFANSHPWAPGGHDFVNEPLSRVRSISGKSTVVTLQTSTARTTTGTTTAVDVGEASSARFRLHVTAVTGTSPTLDVAVQQSHDNTTFTTIDTFRQVTAGTEYSEVVEFDHTARYLRLSYTVAGTTPSFTFSVIGDVNVVGNNLSDINVAVTAAASTKAITFPTRTYSNPTSVALAGGTGGTLTPSTTYYYRIAGRPLRGGPIVPLAQQSVVLTAGQNAVTMSVVGMEQIVAGLQLAGLTIYRGTANGGPYTARFDVLPRTPLYSAALTQSLTDLGPTMTIVVAWPISQTTLGYPPTIPAKTGSFTPADETGFELDANYGVNVTPNWLTTVDVTAKTTGGFTMNFGTPAPAGATVDWFQFR